MLRTVKTLRGLVVVVAKRSAVPVEVRQTKEGMPLGSEIVVHPDVPLALVVRTRSNNIVVLVGGTGWIERAEIPCWIERDHIQSHCAQANSRNNVAGECLPYTGCEVNAGWIINTSRYWRGIAIMTRGYQIREVTRAPRGLRNCISLTGCLGKVLVLI